MNKNKFLYLYKQKGAALIIVLSVLMLLIIMALGIAVSISNEEITSNSYTYGIVARYAAESGVNRAVILLRQEARKNYPDTQCSTQPGEFTF